MYKPKEEITIEDIKNLFVKNYDGSYRLIRDMSPDEFEMLNEMLDDLSKYLAKDFASNF